MEICLVVVNSETQRMLHNHDFGAVSERLGRFVFSCGDAKYVFRIIPIDELRFWPGKLADCYVFESDEYFSPWILNLGRYLPGQHDWTTSAEILRQEGVVPVFPAPPGLVTACRLIVEGKVVPFAPFTTTWLFMRRHYSVLFSWECCEAVGCNYQQHRQLLSALRRGLETRFAHFQKDYRPEPLVTVWHLMEEWGYGVPGVGEKSLEIIQKIVEKHGLRLKMK